MTEAVKLLSDEEVSRFLALSKQNTGPSIDELRAANERAATENATLRERLAQAESLAETRSDIIAAKAAHVDQLQSQLVQVTQRARHMESCKDCQACWEGSQP